MSNARRSKSQIERDRREIARRYLRGDIQADIARDLGVNQSTVSRDLAVVQGQWREDRVHDINERKNIELTRIDELEREYWEAWENSKEDEQTRKVVKRGEKDVRQEVTVKGQVGDASYLRGVQWCIEKRCQILGLDAPKNWDIKSDGKSINPFMTMTNEELQEAAKRFIKNDN